MIRLVAAALAALPLVAFAQQAAPTAAPTDTPIGAPAAAPPAPAPSAGPEARAPSAPARPSAFLGLGYGAAYTEEEHASQGGGGVFRLRVGAPYGGNLMVGLEGGLATWEDGTLAFYDAGLTMYATSWLYARAAFGLTTYTHSGTAEQGVNVLAGLGVVLPRVFGARPTLNFELVNHSMTSGNGIFGNVGPKTFAGWLGVEWF